MKLIETIKKYSEDYFHKDTRILTVYLLGSALTGNMRPDSDIDLAIMPEHGVRIDPLERLEFANDLAYKFERSVDIGEISSANLVYSREALLKGLVIYQKDHEKNALYRANLLGMYIQFNLDRKEVLDAYRAG